MTAIGRRRVEFGDFQTPPELAGEVCEFLAGRGISPATVVEPTCGLGHILLAALSRFPDANALGIEINPAYVSSLRKKLAGNLDERVQVSEASFFDLDWDSTLDRVTGPILILGNPPWVTNSQLGALRGSNLPPKINRDGIPGFDALTGKSNFDISEWILSRLSEALSGRTAWMAMLCKTSVARRVLRYAWTQGHTIKSAELRAIDARRWFGVAVEACLLIVEFGSEVAGPSCRAFAGLESNANSRTFGLMKGRLIADLASYGRWSHIEGASPLRWRSGIKHDASKVMELRRDNDGYRNGFGEVIDLEEGLLFPMLKSSQVSREKTESDIRWMIVPQRAVGESTELLRTTAPKTWAYLTTYRERFDRRASAIYRNRPPFSIFGVGDYTFLPWKVAISGFYKRLHFQVVGPWEEKPVVFDDTVYFISFKQETEARMVASMLNSDVAQEFLGSFIFWDAKRPITAELLNRLDLRLLARELRSEVTLDLLGS